MQDPEWEIPAHELQILETIDIQKGTLSTVYRGIWRQIDVAVKVFDDACLHNDNEPHKDIQNEVHIMTLVHHPSIVLFLGYCRLPGLITREGGYDSDPDPEKPSIALVFEWMHDGNLLTAMKKKRSYEERLRWSREICAGVHYLHRRTPTRIIHRDLKPANVLVGRYGMCKIADFGISKTVMFEKKRSFRNFATNQPPSAFLDVMGRSRNDSFSSTDDQESESSISTHGPVGTFRYMAPELMTNHNEMFRSTTKIDLYSLGMILYVIWEDREPFTEYAWTRTETSCVQRFCREVFYQQLRPTFRKTPKRIQAWIRKCWSADPFLRPDTDDLIRVFDASRNHWREKIMYSLYT